MVTPASPNHTHAINLRGALAMGKNIAIAAFFALIATVAVGPAYADGCPDGAQMQQWRVQRKPCQSRWWEPVRLAAIGRSVKTSLRPCMTHQDFCNLLWVGAIPILSNQSTGADDLIHRP